ncbi:MAG: hypothetical protein IJJ26_13660 [Victivallales bacterium]|nr:hypothetical protein [Victivallales bacterium]
MKQGKALAWILTACLAACAFERPGAVLFEVDLSSEEAWKKYQVHAGAMHKNRQP